MMNNLKTYLFKLLLPVMVCMFSFNVKAQQIYGSPIVNSGEIGTYYVQYEGTCAQCYGGVNYEWYVENGTILSYSHCNAQRFSIRVRWGCLDSNASIRVHRDSCYSGWWWNELTYEEFSDTLNITLIGGTPVVGGVYGTDTVCEGSISTYTTDSVEFASIYDWTVTGGTILSGDSSTTIQVQWGMVSGSQNYTIYVTPSAGGTCVGDPSDNFNVNVQDIASLSFYMPEDTVCGGDTIHFDVNPSFTTGIEYYTWSFPVGVNPIIGNLTDTVTAQFNPFAHSGNITVTSVYACGFGDTVSTPIVVNVRPYPPSTIQGALAVCESDTASYDYIIDSIPNATAYLWEVEGGTLSSDSTSTPQTSIVWDTTGMGSVTVIPVNSCGASPTSSTIDVIIHPENSLTIVDSVGLTDTALTALSSRTLVFNHCETSNGCANKIIDKATLLITYNTGDIYNYGVNVFETSTRVRIVGYGGLNNTTPIIFEDTVDFSISHNNPEQFFYLDFTTDYYQIQSFFIEILDYTADATVEDDIQLTAVYNEDFKYNALSSTPLITSLSASQVSGSNQYEFSWVNSCTEFPSYEIQLLRLYNMDPDNDTDSTVVSANINWDEALTIETQSSHDSIILTLAEGTGYYVWRVRPIGDYYENGIGNDLNWGLWSNHSGYEQGVTGVSPSVTSYVIFYTQFDEDINWIYSRTFTEGNMVEDKQVRIGENMTFANGLQQVKQTQAHLSTANKILTTQTVNDFSGRPALSSMPVPLEDQISLGFSDSFMKNSSGGVYTAEDFDNDTTYNNPNQVKDNTGEHFAYYSNNNIDTLIPNAEAFPFTRTLFYNDGNSRVKEQSGVGETFRIQPVLTNSRTNKTFYSGVADEELIRVFGDEAPYQESVHKVINVDGNRTATVTYIGKDGKTLATCLAINGSNTLDDDNEPLMGLASQSVASLNVADTINNNTPYGEYGNQATTSQTFVEQTDVNVYYDLTPKTVEDICLNYCATCDYYVEIMVQNIEKPDTFELYHSILLPSNICDSTNLYQYDSTIVLAPGTYIFTKKVVANNTDPNTLADTNVIGSTYYEIHLDSIRNAYDSLIYGLGGQLDTIYGYLDSADVNGLYTYLGINLSVNNPDSVYQDSSAYITIGCDTLPIPIILCPIQRCPPNESFAQYFNDFWYGQYTFSSISGGYSNSQFDDMVENMVSDGYICDSLWNCWYAIVQSYGELVDMYDNPSIPSGITFNIVDVFLDCAGRRIEGISTTDFGSPGYLSHAYSYFNYAGGDTLCENYFLNQYAPTSCNSPFGSCFADSTWTEFYQCVKYHDNDVPPAAETDPNLAAQNLTDTCEKYCDAKKQGYIDAIVYAFHQQQYYVAANPDTTINSLYPYVRDKYQLDYDSIWSSYVFNDTIVLNPDTITFIEWSEIECMANALVKHCKEGCALTPVFDTITGDTLLSMGTVEEIAAFQNSFASAYEVSLQNGGVCGEGWETIYTGADTTLVDTTYSVNDTTIIVNSLYSVIEYTGDVDIVVLNGVTTVTFTSYTGKGYSFSSIDSARYGGSGSDVIYKMTVLSDGNYLFYGYSTSSDGDLPGNYGANDAWAIKLDPTLHNVIWSRNYGGSSNEHFRSATSDTSYIYLGGISTSTDGDLAGTSINTSWQLKIDLLTGDVISSTTSSLSIPLTFSDACDDNISNISGDYYKGLDDDFLVLKVSNHSCINTTGVDYEIPNDICDNKFCFRYVDWPTIPDSIPEILPITCEESAVKDIKNAIEHQVYEYTQNKLDEFKEGYLNTCVNPDSIDDTFVVSYPLGYHHYTLYYYNRAGNLIQTVPPQGVDLLDKNNTNDAYDVYVSGTLSRDTFPNHRFITDYEYNSLGQLIKQDTPDGDTTRFYYNNLGQLRFSQNAKQLADTAYSYTKYDELGRIIEVGESTQAAANGDFYLSANIANEDFPSDTAQNSQVTYTVYTTDASGITYLNDGTTTQRYLQNRVSYSYTDEDANLNTTDDQTYTYYSYDPHGNVEWLIQDIPGYLNKQYLRYEYDLVSGNVLKVCYNETRIDQFYHRYSYDADNRIIAAETSLNDIIWEKDASYQYYAHGPLRRAEIGKDNIQGLDYVYTIHGWLKALNHGSLNKSLDPGKDGTNATNNFAKDVFAMQLNYFTGDFNRSGSAFAGSNDATLEPETNRSLYNGNISTWTTNNLQHPLATGIQYPGLTGYQYRYDELNRIRVADFNENISLASSFTPVSAYGTNYRYDANGNIYNLNRKGTPLNLNMDSLKYYYYDASGGFYDETSVPTLPTNKLAYVTDGISGSAYADDIETQPSGNYEYDEIGNLVKDSTEEIAEIRWTVYGKIKEIIRTSGSSKPNLKFIYDASGNRIAKIVTPDPATPSVNTTTWYSRDASGNVMAVYESVSESTISGITEQLYLIEQPLYGSSRIGERKQRTLLKTIKYPTEGSPTETLLPNYERITESTNMLIGVQKPHTVTRTLGSLAYITPQGGGKQDVNFSNPSSPQVDTVTAQIGFGIQGNNLCVVEDENGDVVFSAYTAKELAGAVTNVCRVLDTANNLMVIPLSNPIKSNFEGKSLGIKKPGSSTIYYLITVGTDQKPYYHEVNISTMEVSPNHAIDTASGYGFGMALIEDLTGVAPSSLYLRKHNGNDTADIITVSITTSGFGTPTVAAGFYSKDQAGVGEMQISADGTKLAIANQTKKMGWWANKGEILVYGLDVYHEVLEQNNSISTGEYSMLQSLDFSPQSKYIYYGQQNMVIETSGFDNGAEIKKVDVITENMDSVIGNFKGDIRRAKNNKLYAASNNQTILKQINNTDASESFSNFTLATSPWKTTAGIPLQPIKINNLVDTTDLITRELNNKTYEINDHLGNVRAVVYDRKLSTLNGSTGVPEDFEPEILMTSNYFPFGSLQPNRSFSSGDYRYGFNGKESDNEVSGNGNSYDYGFRIYNPRLGRFLSVDPLSKSYPWYTPYQFAGNNPIKYVDLDGLEEAEPKEHNAKPLFSKLDAVKIQLIIELKQTLVKQKAESLISEFDKNEKSLLKGGGGPGGLSDEEFKSTIEKGIDESTTLEYQFKIEKSSSPKKDDYQITIIGNLKVKDEVKDEINNKYGNSIVDKAKTIAKKSVGPIVKSLLKKAPFSPVGFVLDTKEAGKFSSFTSQKEYNKERVTEVVKVDLVESNIDTPQIDNGKGVEQ